MIDALRPQAGTAPAPQPPPSGGGGQPYNPYDLSTDPALQRINAAMQQAQANADAQAIQARNQLAIDYGDPSLALDDQTRAAAAQNPFSRAAILRQERHDQPIALDNADSASNLFYSSTHGQRQSNLARALLQEEATNRREAQQGLSDIEQGRLGAMSDWQDRLAQAEQDAADRAVQRLGDLPVGGQAGAAAGTAHAAAGAARHGRHPRTPRSLVGQALAGARPRPGRHRPYTPAYRP